MSHLTVFACIVSLIAIACLPSPVSGGTVGLPPFSWDSIPVFAHCSNTTGNFNSDMLHQFGRSSFIVLEKYQGLLADPVNHSAEIKIITAAKQIKDIYNDNVHVYAYLQVDVARTWYDSAGVWFDNHPECELMDPLTNKALNFSNDDGYWRIYGYNTECGKQAWIKSCKDFLASPYISGLFLDGYRMKSASSLGYPFLQNATLTDQQAWMKGIDDTANDLKLALPSGTVVIDNPAFFSPQVANGRSLEFFDGSPMTMMQLKSFASKGLVVEAHAPTVSGQSLTATVAAFLITAGEYSYYGSGDWSDCPSYFRPELQSYFNQKLGKPDGEAMQTGNKFTRLFGNGAVKVSHDFTGGAPFKSCIRWSDGTSVGNDC